MNLYSIETGNFKLDGGAMFGVVPKIIWKKYYPADENNLCNWAMRSLLIVDGDKKILIDNGMGDKQSDKFFRNYHPNGSASLEKSLQTIGYGFDDITDVILTHLHFDHCGGSVRYNEKKELETTFKNAKYWISSKQWDWALNPNRREKASFLNENIIPIKDAGQLNLIENEMQLYDNIEIKLYDGHTSGQIIPYINYNGRTIAFGGDLFPSTAHLPMPYIMGYDTQPLQTLKDRERFFNDAIKYNQILFFQHDLYNECCSLYESPKGVRAKKTFLLSDFIKNPNDY